MSEKKLKILVIFNSLVGVIGGGSRHIVEVANYWSTSNKVHFFISKAGYKVAESHIQKDPNLNKEVILYTAPFDESKNRYLNYLFRTIKSIMELRKLKERYDVVIAPNYLPQNMIPCIFMKGKAKRVVYFHVVPPSARFEVLKKMNFLRRTISIMNWKLCVFLARSFDLIFVVNEATRDYFIETGFPLEKVVVVNNGIPCNEIENVDVKIKKYEGVFLGRLVWNKGIYDLVDIWGFVVEREPSMKLCIIGDGPERGELEKKIKEKGLSENIKIEGWKEGEEKYRLMKESRVFVYPSYQEAQPVVILEALACGLPVVGYDLPIYQEIFNEYIITAETGNSENMAENVLGILENEEKHRKVVEDAKEVLSKYDWKEIANHQLACIEKLL